MTPTILDIKHLLLRELKTFVREIELFPDDEMPWQTLPGIGNSAGNLALHVSGNLRHFIGSTLGRTGYIRHREAEFDTRAGSRTEIVRELEDTITMVTAVFAKIDEQALSKTYPLEVGGNSLSGARFLLHLCTHTAFHLGQAGYLRRALTGNTHSAGGVSVREIADR